MLSILLHSELYSDNDELIVDEIFLFFMAGMMTIQVSSTNTIYYMNMYPKYKKKVLQEIMPIVEKANENILNNLDYDTVMEFDYLQ